MFEQGEECSVRGRISAREEKRTSPVQGMKEVEKQCGIKLWRICWVGSWAPWAWVDVNTFCLLNMYMFREQHFQYSFSYNCNFSWKCTAAQLQFFPQIHIAGNHSNHSVLSVTATRPDGNWLAQSVMLPPGLPHYCATWCNGYDRLYCRIIKAGQE